MEHNLETERGCGKYQEFENADVPIKYRQELGSQQVVGTDVGEACQTIHERVLGFPYLKSFWVSWCLFLGFLLSKFLGLKVSKIYQMPMSCFLEHIDPISKLSNKL